LVGKYHQLFSILELNFYNVHTLLKQKKDISNEVITAYKTDLVNFGIEQTMERKTQQVYWKIRQRNQKTCLYSNEQFRSYSF
jgi:hypothetical protein